MRVRTLLLLGVVLQATPVFAHPGLNSPDVVFQAPDGVTDRVDAVFAQLVARGFTGYVAVSVAGQLIYARGQDSAARHFSLDTPVDILSMTKSLTGAAVARLMVEGRLSADTRLDEIWSDLPADKSAITAHELLTHSSGLPHALGDDTEYLDKASYLARAWATPLRFKPGTQYDYSNVGYTVLAAIIERVTGRSYEQYLREAVLTPAGMTETGYYSVCCERPDSAYVANISWGGDRPSWHLIGNGGLLSTPRDMIRWINANEAGRLGTGVHRLTHQPWMREGEKAPTFYGYGLIVEDDKRFGRAYWHNGGSRAFNGNWHYYADHDVAIFVTSDQWKIDPDTVEQTIARSIFDGGAT